MVASLTKKDATIENAVDRFIEASPGKTVQSLASLLGVSHQAVYNAKSKAVPPDTWYAKMGRETEVSLDWLLTGRGPMERVQRQVKDVDTTAIPKVKARLSAGTGSLETSGETERFCYFRSDWVNRKCRPNQCVVMDVGGDSMEPVIRDKDIVLVDQGQTEIITGNIYAIGIEDEVLIKYVDRVPGNYVLRSANKEYTPINVDLRDESLNIRIIGRVLWMGREL